MADANHHDRPLTPRDIDAVQASFRAVLPIKDAAAALFYGRLFEIHPATRPIFAGVDLNAQGGKLMAAIGFVVGALRQPEAMLPAVRAMGMRHAGYGVTDGHYESVGQALLWTLEQGLGDAWTPQLAAAWGAAYAMLSEAMMDAAHRATAVPHPDAVLA